MRRCLAMAFLLAAALRGAAEGEPRRIALEQWQLARLRVGAIVECEGVVKNASGDRLEAIVVAAEFFGADGKKLGCTPAIAVDNAGDIGKMRQGLIARLDPGGESPISIRAPRIPAFAAYAVSVSYAAGGRPFVEIFDGSPSRPPERRERTQSGADRLAVRIVKQSFSAGAAPPGQPRPYTLELRLKNTSVLDAVELTVTLETTAAGAPVKTIARPLEPSVLKAGQEGVYRVDCGALPPFDAHRISVAFKEPAAPVSPGPEGGERVISSGR